RAGGGVVAPARVREQGRGAEGGIAAAARKRLHHRLADADVVDAGEGPVEEVVGVPGGGVRVGVEVDAADVGEGRRRRQQTDRAPAGEGDRDSTATGPGPGGAGVEVNAEPALRSHVASSVEIGWAEAKHNPTSRDGSAPVRGYRASLSAPHPLSQG